MNIKIDGQEFNLDPSVVKAMLRLTENTRKDGRERGFNLCKLDSGITVPGPICKGDECHVTLKGCYVKDDKNGHYIGRQVGSFHTHPEDLPANWGDLFGAVKQGINAKRRYGGSYEYLECIGTPDSGIKCSALKEVSPDFALGLRAEYILGLTNDEDEKLLESYFTDIVHIPIEELKNQV
ncbi:MAG: hypothetical protein Q8O55_02215 [Dehalococcoidales bacterium]|nr:hypothetical protein [Dehalococcoidales bacterium]